MLSIQWFKYSLLPCFTLVGVKMPQVYGDIAVVMHTELFRWGHLQLPSPTNFILSIMILEAPSYLLVPVSLVFNYHVLHKRR